MTEGYRVTAVRGARAGKVYNYPIPATAGLSTDQQVVARAKVRQAAYRMVDRLDNEYGACASRCTYFRQSVEA